MLVVTLLVTVMATALKNSRQQTKWRKGSVVAVWRRSSCFVCTTSRSRTQSAAAPQDTAHGARASGSVPVRAKRGLGRIREDQRTGGALHSSSVGSCWTMDCVCARGRS
eukprot:1343609-Amphidinium_carterae.1